MEPPHHARGPARIRSGTPSCQTKTRCPCGISCFPSLLHVLRIFALPLPDPTPLAPGPSACNLNPFRSASIPMRIYSRDAEASPPAYSQCVISHPVPLSVLRILRAVALTLSLGRCFRAYLHARYGTSSLCSLLPYACGHPSLTRYAIPNDRPGALESNVH